MTNQTRIKNGESVSIYAARESDNRPRVEGEIIQSLSVTRAGQSRLISGRGLGTFLMGIIAAVAIGCGGETLKDCENNCQKKYEECMARASSMGDEIECGQLKQICAGNCISDMTGMKTTITGPGTDESFTTKMKQDINSATENSLEAMEDCPCQETEGHEN